MPNHSGEAHANGHGFDLLLGWLEVEGQERGDQEKKAGVVVWLVSAIRSLHKACTPYLQHVTAK